MKPPKHSGCTAMAYVCILCLFQTLERVYAALA